MKPIFKMFFLLILLSVSLFSQQNQITQYSTIDALLNGMYDGDMTLESVKEYGDFGIGTFNRLNGEMAILDGIVYRINYDGTVSQPDLKTTKTPFVTTTYFQKSIQFEVENLNYDELKKYIDDKLSTFNHFYAVRIKGKFKYAKTRSVPKQSKPYKSLAEVVDEQSIFEFQDVEGDLIGFRSPPFVNGINVPGFHMHFLNLERNAGGHLLAVDIGSAIIEIMHIEEFNLLLPDTDQFKNMHFKTLEHKSLDKVEKKQD